jgi:hypothetical protein
MSLGINASSASPRMNGFADGKRRRVDPLTTSPRTV